MSEFLSRMAQQAPAELVPVIVGYASAEAMQQVNETRALEIGVMLGPAYSLIPAQRAVGTPQALLELQQDPSVSVVWEDLPVTTMLDVSVPKIRAPKMWNLDFEGDGIKVAVVDTGIDPDHPDFEDRVIAMEDFSRSGGAKDGNGHGTHVASTIAGSGGASAGKYIGVAPEARLLIAKVLRDDGSGMTSDVMAGVDWAVQQGAQVVNLSLGSRGPCDGSDALSTLCDAAVDRGVVVCVAAGNSGPSASTVGSPGCARKVVTIGATTDADQVTSFSSRGPTSDGRVKPDVCLPGQSIVAARAKGTTMGTPVDEWYTSASGTSMATPHASGAAALLLQAYPAITPAEVKRRLMESAIDLGSEANVQGSGRGDVLAAYELGVVLPTPTPPPPTPVPTPPPPTPPPPTPTPPPGGCSPFSTASQGTGAREFWWILGILLLLCVCVTCASAALIAIGLGNL